jgi:hypothetical protein
MRCKLLGAAILMHICLGNGLSAQQRGLEFATLTSLVGAWREPQEEGMLYEVWEQANDSVLLGRSFTVRGRDTAPEETVRLASREGAITYSPSVARQNEGKAVVFTLKTVDDSGFVFENAAHDFPQRIRYRLSPKGDSLLAVISGSTAKGYREFRYRYSRVRPSACERMRYFAGHWRLKARTAGNTGTPDITADWQVHPAADDSTCLVGNVVLSKGDTFTRERIAYDPVKNLFVRTIAATDGSVYSFVTAGWRKDRLTWTGTRSLAGDTVGMKQMILLRDRNYFGAVFYVRQNGKWVMTMSEDLERAID